MYSDYSANCYWLHARTLPHLCSVCLALALKFECCELVGTYGGWKQDSCIPEDGYVCAGKGRRLVSFLLVEPLSLYFLGRLILRVESWRGCGPFMCYHWCTCPLRTPFFWVLRIFHSGQYFFVFSSLGLVVYFCDCLSRPQRRRYQTKCLSGRLLS